MALAEPEVVALVYQQIEPHRRTIYEAEDDSPRRSAVAILPAAGGSRWKVGSSRQIQLAQGKVPRGHTPSCCSSRRRRDLSCRRLTARTEVGARVGRNRTR